MFLPFPNHTWPSYGLPINTHTLITPPNVNLFQHDSIASVRILLPLCSCRRWNDGRWKIFCDFFFLFSPPCDIFFRSPQHSPNSRHATERDMAVIEFAQAWGGEGGLITPVRSSAYERKPSLYPFTSTLMGPQGVLAVHHIHFPGKGHSCTWNHQHTLVHLGTHTWPSFLLVWLCQALQPAMTKPSFQIPSSRKYIVRSEGAVLIRLLIYWLGSWIIPAVGCKWRTTKRIRKAVAKAKLLWSFKGWGCYIVDGYLILLQVLALWIAGKEVEQLRVSLHHLLFPQVFSLTLFPEFSWHSVMTSFLIPCVIIIPLYHHVSKYSKEIKKGRLLPL